MYTKKTAQRCRCAFGVAVVAFSLGATPALAKQGAQGDNQIRLLMSGDWHGTLEPHAAVFRGPEPGDPPTYATAAGGLAKVTTVIKDNYLQEKTVYLNCGDLTHGSAEGLFTVGDAVMKAVNAVDKAIEDFGGHGFDAFTPGNWDFGYGPAVFRNRFAALPPFPPIPANIGVMAAYEGADATNTERNSIIQTNFDSVSINLKNAANGSRILPPYKIVERNNLRIAIIGITASIVPQQADTFNIGLRFEQVQELEAVLAEVEAEPEGVDLIVVQSELGLAQNIEIARSFKAIDVMYSAHTHETTHGALIADWEKVTRTKPGAPLSGEDVNRLARGAAIVVETDRDMYVGRLDVQVAGRKIVGFDWKAIPVGDDVFPDPDVAAVVAAVEEPFIAGVDGQVSRHTFMPGGYCTPPSPADCGDTDARGLQLVQDLDTVVGQTDVLLERHHVLEGVLNNFIADAIRDVTNTAVSDPAVAKPEGWTGVDISMTNGFRFGTAVLSTAEVPDGTVFFDGRAVGEITLRDLYSWFPVAPALTVADFSGAAVVKSLEEILDAVFSRNPFIQRGGWYLGLANMTQKIDLINRPFSSSSGRIIETKVGGTLLDLSKRYVFASCYGHGDPIDQVCRTGGGANHRFFTLDDADDPLSGIGLAEPKVLSEPVIVGAKVNQVAPDNFLHPVHALQRYLSAHDVTEGPFAVGRVVEVNSTDPTKPPAYTSKIDPTFIQPPEGAGPMFLSGQIGQ